MVTTMMPLPRSWYCDADHHDRELAAVFGRAWLPAVHASALSNPGDYVATLVGGRDIFVVMDRDRTILAFHNICRGCSHRLLEGTGRLPDGITCPHHAWTYRFSGSLHNPTQMSCRTGSDMSNFDLVRVRTAMFAGFVFVCLGDRSGDSMACLRDLEDLLLHDHPRLPIMREVRRREAVLHANWKTIVENYLECYHCDIAHPSFGNFDLSTWKHIVHRGWTRQGRVAPGSNDVKIDDDDFIGLSAWWQWPNIFWARALNSGSFVASFHEPVAPDRTLQIRVVYAETGEEDDDLRRFNNLFDEVFHEDRSVVESVQRGLGSRGYRGGVLVEQQAARAGWSEHAVHHFQDLVRKALDMGAAA